MECSLCTFTRLFEHKKLIHIEKQKGNTFKKKNPIQQLQQHSLKTNIDLNEIPAGAFDAKCMKMPWKEKNECVIR